jgi:hypothetical protein
MTLPNVKIVPRRWYSIVNAAPYPNSAMDGWGTFESGEIITDVKTGRMWLYDGRVEQVNPIAFHFQHTNTTPLTTDAHIRPLLLNESTPASTQAAVELNGNVVLSSLPSISLLGTDQAGKLIEGTPPTVNNVYLTALNPHPQPNIPKGAVVRVTGAQGAKPTVGLAQANAYNTTDSIGLAAEEILSGAEGLVLLLGTLIDLDTTAYTEGLPLYLSATTAGAVTNIEPTKPNWQMQIGFCVRSHPNKGEILVRPNLESTKTEYISDMTSAGEALAKLAPMAEGSVLARPQGSGAGNPSALSLGYALFGIGSLSVGLSQLSSVLASTVTMTNANQWYNGPSVTLTNGTWLVQANLTLQKAALTGTNPFAIRITNTTTTYASAQMAWTTTASVQGSLDCSCIIVITGGSTVIHAQAASAYAGGSIATSINLIAVGSASQISAVRIA